MIYFANILENVKCISLVIQWLGDLTTSSYVGAWVPSMVRELRSYMPCVAAKTEKVTYWDRKQISVSLGLGVRWG